jgi:hypothetical protein
VFVEASLSQFDHGGRLNRIPRGYSLGQALRSDERTHEINGHTASDISPMEAARSEDPQAIRGILR